MAKLNKINGSTSVLLRVFIMDSTSTVGAGKTGLTEASAGLIIGTIADVESATTRYRASSSEIETISTLGTYAAPTSGKCRFKEVDPTNHPGLYEIQLADARFAVSNAKALIVTLSGASGAAQVSLELQLDPVPADVRSWLGTAVSTPTVAGVPNVNAKTWNDLTTVALPLVPTTAGRTLDVSATGEAGLDWANIGAPTTTVNLSGTTIAAVTGSVGSVTGSVGSVTGSVGSVTGSVGGNVVGSVGSVTGSVGSVTGSVGSVTGSVGGNVVGSVGSVASTVDANITHVIGAAVQQNGSTATNWGGPP